MDEQIIPLFADPADHSAVDRTHAIAAILAAGLLRLPFNLASPGTPANSAWQKSLESLPNQLDVSAEQSVTVHAG